jgi:hypothetical protein
MKSKIASQFSRSATEICIYAGGCGALTVMATDLLVHGSVLFTGAYATGAIVSARRAYKAAKALRNFSAAQF